MLQQVRGSKHNLLPPPHPGDAKAISWGKHILGDGVRKPWFWTDSFKQVVFKRIISTTLGPREGGSGGLVVHPPRGCLFTNENLFGNNWCLFILCFSLHSVLVAWQWLLFHLLTLPVLVIRRCYCLLTCLDGPFMIMGFYYKCTGSCGERFSGQRAILQSYVTIALNMSVCQA